MQCPDLQVAKTTWPRPSTIKWDNGARSCAKHLRQIVADKAPTQALGARLWGRMMELRVGPSKLDLHIQLMIKYIAYPFTMAVAVLPSTIKGGPVCRNSAAWAMLLSILPLAFIPVAYSNTDTLPAQQARMSTLFSDCDESLWMQLKAA